MCLSLCLSGKPGLLQFCPHLGSQETEASGRTNKAETQPRWSRPRPGSSRVPGAPMSSREAGRQWPSTDQNHLQHWPRESHYPCRQVPDLSSYSYFPENWDVAPLPTALLILNFFEWTPPLSWFFFLLKISKCVPEALTSVWNFRPLYPVPCFCSP